MTQQDPITQAAELIRNATVIIGTTDLNRNLDKQKLFLVVARFIEAQTLSAGHMEDHPDIANRRIAVADDVDHVKALLDQLPIAYTIETDDSNYLTIYIAKDDATLQRYLAADIRTKNLMSGVPATAFDASEDQKFTFEEQDSLLTSDPEYTELAALVNFFLSKQNYQDELATIRSWHQALEQYNLLNV